MNKNVKILGFRFRIREAFWLLLLSISAQCFSFDFLKSAEKITNFNCTITVHPNAEIIVSENISVDVHGHAIKHGLVREIPLYYKDRFGNTYAVRFTLDTVLLDKKTVEYTTQYKNNGVYIYIGDPDNYVSHGVHTYTISYTMQRVIGFFENHDELYWNITGNGWRFPIDSVHAHISLPETINKQDITVDSYTGAFGSTTNHAQTKIGNNTVTLTSTQPLKKYHGVTIAVAFPKGHIQEPHTNQKILWFFQDNGAILWLIMGLLLLIALYSNLYFRIRASKPRYTIIPLFEPPQDFSPADVFKLHNKHFSNKAFVANIVWAAVKGFITISSKQEWISSTYSLSKTDKPTSNKQIQAILDQLFAKNTAIKITNANHLYIQQAIQTTQSLVNKKINPYIIYNVLYSLFGIALAAIWIIPALLLQASPLAFILAGLYIPILLIGAILFTTYTPDGHKLEQEILGFKMYLETAEKHIMETLGTPPTKTPELFEIYLPYAIALGVEKQWSKKFVPVFKAYEQGGKAYHPHWYTGSVFRIAALSNFSSSLAGSFSSAISSASHAPGSSSGSGGRGSSGGGSGGGGGGGW